MQDWANRPLDALYVAVFIDAIHVKVRDGQVANRPVYAAIGVNRGVTDVFFLVCDGLKGLPEVVTNVWPPTIVQTRIVHLIRNKFRLVSRRDWAAVKRDIKPIYAAPNPEAALAALEDLDEKWGARYGAMIRLWRNAWEECDELSVSCDSQPGPDRDGPRSVDDAVEACDQRVRHHVR